MKRKLTCLLLFGTTLITWSQSIERSEITSLGNYSSSPLLSLSSSVGQPSVVETEVSHEMILTQGFQQTYMHPLVIEENNSLALNISVYPNPSSSFFNFSFDTKENGSISYKVYDLQGRSVVSSSNIDVFEGKYTGTISCDNFRDAVYYLEVLFDGSRGQAKYISKLIHIQ